MYYRYGKLHRDEGPAIIDVEADERVYYQYGRIHREDGPAFICNKHNEYEFYYKGDCYPLIDWLRLVAIPDEKKAELILRYGE